MRKHDEPHVGYLRCRVCSEHYSVPISNLSKSIDVYNAWLDTCERANNSQFKQKEGNDVIIK